MPQDIWTAVDHYFERSLLGADPGLDAALAANAAVGLPAIDVAPNQGAFLHLLARIARARRILEIGTLGGYSTIWLARALPPDGSLVTIEIDPIHADVAARNLATAGLDHLVDIRVGPALDVLPELAAAGLGPFDLVFVDADKPNNPHYVRWALELSRAGTVLVVDNVVRGGAVVDSDDADPRVQGVRQLVDLVAHDPRVTATTIQTVGAKGHDGFLVAVVTAAQ